MAVNPKAKKGFIEILNGNKKGEQIEILYFPPEYSFEKVTRLQRSPFLASKLLTCST